MLQFKTDETIFPFVVMIYEGYSRTKASCYPIVIRYKLKLLVNGNDLLHPHIFLRALDFGYKKAFELFTNHTTARSSS